jgi:hypothetical protein
MIGSSRSGSLCSSIPSAVGGTDRYSNHRRTPCPIPSRRLYIASLPWPASAPPLVFAALHLSNPGATALAGATVAVDGLMFCALYALTGTLWVPIGLHLAWNFTQAYLFGAAVSGNALGHSIAVSTARSNAPTWLTGGAFGPRPRCSLSSWSA